jgi:hypothetical protein
MPSRLFAVVRRYGRRPTFDFARDLQLSGDLTAAEDLFVQATDLAPGFATAWFTLGKSANSLATAAAPSWRFAPR